MRVFKVATTFLLFFSTLALVTSCGTIMNGSYQSIGISSNPTNASIYVDTIYVGITPRVVKMTRRDNHILRIELDGYKPYEIVITREISRWVAGNIIFGGFFGLALDVVSGGVYVLSVDQVRAEMQSNHIAYSENFKKPYIAVVLAPNPSWKKIGNLIAVN